MIDTHCHLTDPRLREQIDAVLTRAEAAGVSRVVTIGCEPQDARAAVDLAQRHPQVWAAVGLHPCYLPNAGREKSHEAPPLEVLDAFLRSQCERSRVAAIGEIGLDRHWDASEATFKLQRAYFEFQLQIAVDLRMPVILHTREAVDDALDVLANFPSVRAVFHSFTGTQQQAQRITDRGYLIGFTGPITYKKNNDLRAAAAVCPIEQLVVETDGPYLSPEPVRSQRVNEPAYVVHTARRIADLKGISLADFDRATTANAQRFFRW